jgi:hypothetical protein
VELLVISFAQIIKKIARPRTAITTIRIEPRIKAQRFACHDRNQFLAGDQLIELSLILNSRQFEAVDFFVLAQQRFAGRTEYRIPKEAAEMGTVLGRAMCVLAGHDLMQPKSLPAHCGSQKYQ